MKRFSMLAIAAVAALALTAAIGSATASATVLCKTLKSPCPSSEILPAGSYLTYGHSNSIVLDPNTFKLKGQGGWGTEFNCSLAIFAEQTTAEISEPLPATGGRALDRCTGAGRTGTCTMSLGSSTDNLWGSIKIGWILPVTATTLNASCSGGILGTTECNWSGKINGNVSQTAEENHAVFKGTFTYVSGTSQEKCGGEKAAMETAPLIWGGSGYMTGP